MKKFVTAALLTSATSAFAAGQFSPLISYERVFNEPSTVSSETSGMLNAAVEYTFPRSLSVYGGVQLLQADGTETSAQIGARFYTTSPLFFINGQMPVWPYIGAGVNLLNHAAYYPEVGIRFGISPKIRLDAFMKTYNSNDLNYDKHATLGIGLSF